MFNFELLKDKNCKIQHQAIKTLGCQRVGNGQTTLTDAPLPSRGMRVWQVMTQIDIMKNAGYNDYNDNDDYDAYDSGEFFSQ